MRKLTKKEVQGRIDASGSGLVMIGEYYGMNESTDFMCKCGLVYKARPANTLKPNVVGCKSCAQDTVGKKRIVPEDDIREKLASKNIEMLEDYVKASDRYTFKCGTCSDTWVTTLNSILAKRSTGCPQCGGRKKLNKEIINKRLGDRGIILVGDYTNSRTKTLFKAKCGHTWETTTDGVLNDGTGCPYCAGRMRLTVQEVDRRFAKRGLRRIGEYVNVDTKTETECLECGHVWFPSVWNATKAGGCPECHHSKVRFSEDQVQQRLDEDGRGFKLVGKYERFTKPTEFSCICGNVWQTRLSAIIQGFGCPACHYRSDSVYIWRSEGEILGGKQMYKVGVTTFTNGALRMRQCANKSNRTPTMICMAKVTNAWKVEKILLNIGQNPLLKGFDGATEMRLMTDEELSKAVKILSEHAIEYLT